MNSPSPAAAPLLRFDAPVALIGGGAVDAGALAEARARATALIAADGGANRFAGEKGAVHAVIGDLDSLEDRAGWAGALGERLIHLPEQDTTDLEKCLYSVAAPLYLGVGFLGARADHSLGAAHLLLKRAAHRLILLDAEDALFLLPRRWRARLPVGTRVSLFPLAPTRALASSGLRWPLDGLELAIGGVVSTSNEAAAEEVAAEFAPAGESGWSSVLGVLPRAHLAAAIESVTEAVR